MLDTAKSCLVILVAVVGLVACRAPQLSFTIPVCAQKGVDCGCALPGWIICHDVCVDPSVSRDHCGACDQGCKSGTVCLAGQCGSDCGAASNCDGVCAFTASNPWHCGGCGTPCEGACSGGMCRPSKDGCPAGQVLCLGACTDLQRDRDNCGGCGVACPLDSVCFVDRSDHAMCCAGTVCGTSCFPPSSSCPQ